VNCHLDLTGPEVLDGIGHSGVALEAQYRELLQESVRHDFLIKRRIRDLQGR